MELKDRRLLANWLEEGTPIETVCSSLSSSDSAAMSISDKARRAYELIWNWSAPRYIGSAGTAQDRFFERCGRRALERRIQRAKWIAVQFCA